MCGTENKSSTIYVDVIDSWHKRWPQVLKQIETDGGRGKLMVDRDNWLSARQCLLVAFNGDDVAGHLGFRMSPMAVEQQPEESRHAIEAHLDDLSVRTGFDEPQVRQLLMDCARRYAGALRVNKLVNFG